MSDALFRKLQEEGSAATKSWERNAKIAKALYLSLFAQQRAVLDDPNDYLCVRTPRRSGKSYVCVVAAIRICLLKPRARVLLCGLTIKSVRGSFWRILDEVIISQGINAESNRTELSWKFDNGSVLMLAGCETMDRIERLRGDEYDLVVVDEAKSFSPDALTYLLFDVIKAAVTTRLGKIWLTGTPGHIFSGPFFYASNPGKKDRDGRVHSAQYVGQGRHTETFWSFHTWTMKDNIKAKGQWDRAVEDRIKMNWDESHPTWRREFLGEWVLDESGLVFSFQAILQADESKVVWKPDVNRPGQYGLPDADWHFILGIDFGYENPTAFTVAAYSQNLQELREVHSEKHQHLVISQVAALYRQLERRYGGFEVTIVDAGAQGDMIWHTLQTDYGIPAIQAEKREKQAFIQLCNSDFYSGKIKLQRDSALAKEMSEHCWDLSEGSREELARKGQLKEHPSSPNDLCDSFLYLWRWSMHRFYEAAPEKLPDFGTESYFQRQERLAKEKEIERRRMNKMQSEFEEGEFDGEDFDYYEMLNR